MELELEGWRCRDGSRSKCRSQEMQSVSRSWEGQRKNFSLEKFTWNSALAITRGLPDVLFVVYVILHSCKHFSGLLKL